MKRLHNILRLLLLTILMGSCTLMMEDYTKEEEKKVDLTEVGREEPYTLETEYGDITFQYGDSTKVLSEDAVDYLVTVEDDSILYFSDNIPRDLLVPVGEYITMGCNEHLRHGLCSKVVELTQANGMFKMVTTRVPHGKVFKKLDMDIKLDYDQQMAFDPEDYLDEQDVSGHAEDSTLMFTDWTLFGPEVVARKEAEVKRRAAERRALTRAEDDDEEGDVGKDYTPDDEDSHVQTAKEKDIRIFTINNGKISKFNNKFAQLTQKGLVISVVGSYHEKTTVRHIQKVSNGQDYVCDVYDETPSFHLKINAGVKKSKKMANKELAEKYVELFAGLSEKERKQLFGISPNPFMIHIPLPVPFPVEFFIRIGPKVEASFSLMGEVEFEKGLGLIHKEVVYDRGKVIKKEVKPNKNKNNEFDITKFDIYGRFEVSGTIEILGGFAVTGGAFGLGAGADLTAKFTFQLSLPPSKNDGGDFDISLNPKIKAFAQSPAGADWLSLDFSIPGVKQIFLLGPVKEPFFPAITNPSGKVKLQDDYSGGVEAVVSGSYQISELNMIKYVGAQEYQVGAYFYEQQGGNEVFLGKSEAQTLLKYKAKYDFSFVDADYKAGKKYKMVPYIEHKGTGEIYRYDDNSIPCDVASNAASMTFKNLFIHKHDYDGEYEYWDVYLQVQISNLAKMTEWKRFGAIVTMDRLELGTDNVIDRPTNNKKINVTELVYENNVDMKFRIKVKPRDAYDFEMSFTPYYETQEGKEVVVKPQDVNKMFIRLARDWEGDNWKYWDGYPTEGAQLVDMGGVGK